MAGEARRVEHRRVTKLIAMAYDGAIWTFVVLCILVVLALVGAGILWIFEHLQAWRKPPVDEDNGTVVQFRHAEQLVRQDSCNTHAP